MDFIKQLEKSDNFQKVNTLDDTFALYQNILDLESNTSLDVTIPDKESEIFMVELYTEFEDGPFWIGRYVENMLELKEFRSSAERLLVQEINNRENEA